MESKRIAVVGAKGYIGRNLVNSLKQSKNEVARLTSADQAQMLKPKFWLDSEFDSIIWLASSVNPLVAQNEPRLAIQEFELFKRYTENISNSDSQIVFISSGGTVYSGQDLPFNENSEANGINAYGRHKVSLENILIECASNFTILRLSNAFGRDQVVKNGQGVIAGWLESAKRRLPISIYGSTSLVRDFIYIDDVTSAIEQVVNKQLVNEVLNIGSGEGTSLEKLISEISLVTGIHLEIKSLNSRSFDRAEVWLDISKAKEKLGWQPVVNLRDGIELTWQAMSLRAQN